MTHIKTKIAEYAVIVKDDKYLLLRFSKKANPGEKWIFPRGRLDIGDKPKEGLLREVKEEKSFEVEIIKPLYFFKQGDGDEEIHAVFFLSRIFDVKEIELTKVQQDVSNKIILYRT